MIPRILNSLLIGVALTHALPDDLCAEPLQTIVKMKKEHPIPDGLYFIPSSAKHGGAEASVQILDGEACFISVTGKHDSVPYQIDLFARDGIEVITIRKGDKRSLFLARAGQTVTPKDLLPEQEQELRAIGLSVTLMINSLSMDHVKYRKEKIKQGAPSNGG